MTLHLRLPWLPAFLRPRILAVDCGACHVACGLFTRGAGGRLELRQLAYEPHWPDANADANWIEATGRALATIVRRQEFTGTCRLALPGQHTLVKFARIPRVEKDRQPGVIEREAQQNIPCPLEQLVWDHLPVTDSEAGPEVMFAAVKSDVAGAVHGAAGAAGFRVGQMVPSCVALLHAFRYNHPDEHTGVLVAEIGARSTHLVFIERHRFYIRSFLLGGDTVTQEVADRLQLDFVAAEALKIQVLTGRLDSAGDSAPVAAVQRAAAHFAGRLHLEIVRSTISCRRHAGAAQPVTVYLTGGGSLIPDLPVMLADKLALRVVRFSPFRKVTVVTPAHAAAEATAPMLAGLVGLATSLVDDDGPGLNLVPPAVMAAQTSRRRQRAMVATALLAVAAPLPVIGYHRHVITAADRTSAEIDRRLKPLRALAAHNVRNLARLEEMKHRIDAIRGVVESRTDWIDFLNDLQDRLAKTGDAWLEKLQIAHPAAGSGSVPEAPSANALRFTLGGWMLDRNNPGSRSSADSSGRLRGLLELLGQSPFIAAVESERFDHAQPGLLRFDFTVVLHPRKPL